MWPFSQSSKVYLPVKSSNIEEEDSIDLDELRAAIPPPRRRRRPYLIGGGILTVIGLAILTFAYKSTGVRTTSPSSSGDTSMGDHAPGDFLPGAASSCPIRREWRTITQAEKDRYISAVKCLGEQPSTLHDNLTLYEDFPWVHSHVGYYTHNSAPFLPWHRYFLHVYEDILRSTCGFRGELVYWDWTLDWDDLEHSPVFDADSGFGGDGDPQGEITVGNTGRCVVDGPFKDVIASYYDVEYKPHCLSRGFRDDNGTLGHIDGHQISPDSIEEVLQLDDYEAFVTEMESRVHDAIPFGIGGDFETFTAPYDPLFFLHHTQLDRLWWLWQQRNLPERLSAYGGHIGRHTIEMASLTDKLKMQALAPEIAVQEVMNTEGDMLCYRY